MLVAMFVLLLVGLAVFVALGVEESRHWRNFKPARLTPPPVTLWEDSLPTTRFRPWLVPAVGKTSA